LLEPLSRVPRVDVGALGDRIGGELAVAQSLVQIQAQSDIHRQDPEVAERCLEDVVRERVGSHRSVLRCDVCGGDPAIDDE
jgi:hypothetical protein